MRCNVYTALGVLVVLVCVCVPTFISAFFRPPLDEYQELLVHDAIEHVALLCSQYTNNSIARVSTVAQLLGRDMDQIVHNTTRLAIARENIRSSLYRNGVWSPGGAANFIGFYGINGTATVPVATFFHPCINPKAPNVTVATTQRDTCSLPAHSCSPPPFLDGVSDASQRFFRRLFERNETQRGLYAITAPEKCPGMQANDTFFYAMSVIAHNGTAVGALATMFSTLRYRYHLARYALGCTSVFSVAAGGLPPDVAERVSTLRDQYHSGTQQIGEMTASYVAAEMSTSSTKHMGDRECSQAARDNYNRAFVSTTTVLYVYVPSPPDNTSEDTSDEDKEGAVILRFDYPHHVRWYRETIILAYTGAVAVLLVLSTALIVLFFEQVVLRRLRRVAHSEALVSALDDLSAGEADTDDIGRVTRLLDALVKRRRNELQLLATEFEALRWKQTNQQAVLDTLAMFSGRPSSLIADAIREFESSRRRCEPQRGEEGRRYHLRRLIKGGAKVQYDAIDNSALVGEYFKYFCATHSPAALNSFFFVQDVFTLHRVEKDNQSNEGFFFAAFCADELLSPPPSVLHDSMASMPAGAADSGLLAPYTSDTSGGTGTGANSSSTAPQLPQLSASGRAAAATAAAPRRPETDHRRHFNTYLGYDVCRMIFRVYFGGKEPLIRGPEDFYGLHPRSRAYAAMAALCERDKSAAGVPWRPTMYDALSQEVSKAIKTSLYPMFVKSPLFGLVQRSYDLLAEKKQPPAAPRDKALAFVYFDEDSPTTTTTLP